MSNYYPRPNTLPAKVVQFFLDNPAETLYLDDITGKFGGLRNSLHTNLAPCVSAELLVRKRDDLGEYIYQAGPELQPAQPAPAGPSPTKRKPTRTAPSGYTAANLMFDVSTLHVDDNVPYLPNGTAGRSKWQPLFDKLKHPGQSCAIPGEIKGAVAAAAAKLNSEKTRGTYKVHMTSKTEARVWRTA